MKLKFEPRNFNFNKKAKSENLNEMNKELSLDLFQIYDELSRQDSKLNEFNQMLMLNNQKLENMVNDLQTTLDSIVTDTHFVNFYNTENVSFGEDIEIDEIMKENRCMYEPDYNTLMLKPLNSRPKTYLSNLNDEITVPEDLNVEITDDTSTDNYNIEENDINKAFNQNSNQAWIKNYIYDSGTEPNSITVTIDIQIPKSIITNMFANALFISPFPKNTIDINTIEYSTVNNSGYETLSSFSGVVNSNNTVISFYEKQITNIRITLTQDSYNEIDNGNKRVFTIGASNIAVYDNKYSKESTAYVKFDPPVAVDEITSLEPIVDNPEDSDKIETKVYGINIQDSSMMSSVNLNEPISYNNNEVFWIETTIKSETGTYSPVLKGFDIQIDPV